MKVLPHAGFLPKLLLGISLFGVPGSVLFSGSAQAATPSAYNACGSGTPPSLNPFSILFSKLVEGDTFQCQDKKITIGDPSQLKLGDDGRGTLEIEWNAFPPSGFENDFFSLDFDFSPSRLTSSSIGFSYLLEVTDPRYALDTVQLDSDINQSNSADLKSSVTKQVRRDRSDIKPFVSLVSDRLDPQESAGLEQLTSIYVTDKWFVGDLSTIDSFKNTYTQVLVAGPPEEVPGPLPLLGAGTAFGFSRRLRSRIKGSRLA